jgi:hypothetical protein
MMIKFILTTLIIMLLASGSVNSAESKYNLLDVGNESILKIKFNMHDLYITTNDLFMQKYKFDKEKLNKISVKDDSYVSEDFVQFVGVFVNEYKSPRNLKLKIKFSNYRPDSGLLNIKFNF